jgi:small-conductance mechanosensitive channel
MNLATILDRAGEGLGGFLPRLAGALVLLVVGWLAVALIRRVLARVLRAAGLDALGERIGANDVLARFGLGRSLTSVIAGAVRIGLLVVVVFAALSLLGLEFLSDSLNAGILFLPRLLVAIVLLLAGVLLAEIARRQVDRLAQQMDLPGPLGLLVEVAVVAVFSVTALAELGVPVSVLLLIVAIVLAGIALTFALAFGIGGQAMAREVSARRYVESSYEVGQDVSLGGVRGRISAIDATCTVLETSGGDTLRVPNSQLIASIVTVHPSS